MSPSIVQVGFSSGSSGVDAVLKLISQSSVVEAPFTSTPIVATQTFPLGPEEAVTPVEFVKLILIVPSPLSFIVPVHPEAIFVLFLEYVKR